MTVSVIIPTHNRSEMLVNAINSAFAQRDVDVDVIVVDDASTDSTAKVMASYEGVTYLRNLNSLGPGKTRQKGYLAAKGEYIVFLDDDDYYTDFFFYKKAIDLLEDDSRLAFVSGNVKYYYAATNKFENSSVGLSGHINGSLYFEKFMIGYNKPASTFPTVFRKSVLEQAGFDNMEMMNDSSIYLRALLFGDAYILDDVIGVYTIHETNISKTINLPFLYENLKEKLRILNFPQCTIKDPKYWWYQHYKLTYLYYIASNHDVKKELSMLMWGIYHLNGSLRMFSYIATRLIRFPYRVFRRL